MLSTAVAVGNSHSQTFIEIPKNAGLISELHRTRKGYLLNDAEPIS